ncbi:MAG: macro domain-containing protein [Candidatus Woesearchaeota archaeon]|jgi:O-acetyl-ADP-ribose deacetylase (regulator of RNase III)
MKINTITGDITTLHADAIVNSANRSILGGGGVDGAIHRVAGPELLDECLQIRKEKLLNGLPVGSVIQTKGYKLPCKYVIHTVGPQHGKEDLFLLKKCYLNSLILAETLGCKNVSFPAISTGAFNVPMDISAKFAKEAIDEFILTKPQNVETINFVLSNEIAKNIFELILNKN